MAENKMKDLLSGNALLTAIIYVLIGLIMLVFGRGSIDLVFLLSGLIYIVLGIVEIILKSVDVKGGVITIIIGVIFLIIWAVGLAEPMCGILLILSAVMALLGSSSKIAETFGIQQIDTGNALLNKIFTVVLLIVGILLIAIAVGVDDSGITDILIRVGGLVILILGIIDLVKALK